MAVKPIYGVGLDAGSRHTRLAVSVLEEDDLRFIGYGAAESAGWLKGVIADQSAVSENRIAIVKEKIEAIRVPAGWSETRPKLECRGAALSG